MNYDPRYQCHVIDNRCGSCFACKRSRVGMFTRFTRGFTIIELMIVLAILGILAAVVIPAYKEYALKQNTTPVVENGQVVSGASCKGGFLYNKGADGTDTPAVGPNNTAVKC